MHSPCLQFCNPFLCALALPCKSALICSVHKLREVTYREDRITSNLPIEEPETVQILMLIRVGIQRPIHKVLNLC